MTRPGAVAEDRLLAFADQLRSTDPREEQRPEQEEVWVTFAVGSELFGLPVGSIREVARMPPITHVPGAPPAVTGVVNLRGHSIPIVDLGRLLGLDRPAEKSTEHVLVVEHQGRAVGLAVERVERVVKLLPSHILASSQEAAGGLANARILGTWEDGATPVTLLAPDFLRIDEDRT
jgi:purine-binding chemotaxis protein CheW